MDPDLKKKLALERMKAKKDEKARLKLEKKSAKEAKKAAVEDRRKARYLFQKWNYFAQILKKKKIFF